ncbi:MAG: glycosyltransferase involved in cell wall biosynthesis [Sphingobacteriales bacterium]|jgi:glycosyltransferase involved in cell wall biosynthesis
MVLSICIPVFNYGIADLVRDLLEQLSADVELVLLDDGSHPDCQKENQDFLSQIHAQVRYSELPENVGRTKIRQELARLAKGKYLLFLDCDVRVYSPNFVANYLGELKKGEAELLIGGRRYPKVGERGFEIHYYYGTSIETKTAKQREKIKSYGFQSNNFLILASLFPEIQPQLMLEGYGHEDTLMGMELSRRGIRIQHIENPVFHEGLDNNEAFIRKSEQGLRNLYRIGCSDTYGAQAKEEIRLLRLVEKWRVFQPLFRRDSFQKWARNKLMKTYSPLWFQIWKLSFFWRV